MSVAVIERELFGGTCVNTGCTPTKTLHASAYAAHMARRSADFGVTLSGTIGVDLKAVKARKDTVVMRSRSGVESWLKSMARFTVIEGHARFKSPQEVTVGNDSFTSPRIFINVGGRAVLPNLPGVDRVPTLNNRSILELDQLPRHLVVIGGSYIGLEFAQIYRRFGSEVTVVEMKQQLVKLLASERHEVVDFGNKVYDSNDDYPDFAIPLARAVAAGQVDRGILVCGSGVGASVAANKIVGVRAALCHDDYSSRQGVEDDNMNVLCLGGRTMGIAVASDCVNNFLGAKFSGAERHRRRLAKVLEVEASSLACAGESK